MQTLQAEKIISIDKRIWYVIAFSVAFISILRGIRFPNIWTYSHSLFNYDFGFIKRGFWGEIIKQFDTPYMQSYEFFFALSVFIFAVNMIIMGSLIKELIDSEKPVLIGGAIVFSSSLALVFLSHSIGYFDHIGLLVTLVSLKINGFYKKIAFLLIFMPLALLIHEAVLILFFPVIFMSAVFSINQEKFKQQTSLLAFFSIFLLVLSLIISGAILDIEKATQMFLSLQSNTEYTLREDAFKVLYRSTEDNLLIMKNSLNNERFLMMSLSFLITAPVFCFFIYLSFGLLTQSKSKFFLIALSILASLSPLVLHLFALDLHRWNTLTITTSFLILIVVHASMNENASIKTTGLIYPIIVFLVFWGAVSSLPLFDGYYVKNIPFSEHLKYIIEILSGREISLYIPQR